jgi:hypothetical protein
MTTHSPYQQQQPPPPAYPTAPPWASRAETVAEAPATPAYGSVTPYGAPFPEYGELLVPYPEEMANAARPQPPSWWPVVVWTFFFGLLGAVSAGRRAARARRGRNSAAPYWVAWAVTVAAVSVLSGLVVAVGVPAYLAYRENVITEALQSRLQADGQLQAAAHAAATSVTCEPLGPRDRAGMRPYDCLFALDDGRSGTLSLTADSDGNWTAVRKK